MSVNKLFFPALMSLSLCMSLTSCLGNDDEPVDYTEWRQQNADYVQVKADSIGADGKKVFEKIEPVWCPGVFVLAQWHNDRSLTQGNLVPLDNSTVDVIYEVRYIDGTLLDSSYSQTTYGDSVYRCQPNSNIVGFWSMLTNMHVGDSVTCIMPMNTAYGESYYNGVVPYSTLIYHMKLKSIYAYEVADR